MIVTIREDGSLQFQRTLGEITTTNPVSGEVLEAVEAVRQWAENWQDPEKAALELAVAIAMEQTDDQTAEALSAAVKVWTEGERVEAGWLRSFGGKIYKATKTHTAQRDWKPPDTPSLWVAHTKTTEGAQVAEWVRPLGAHDAYNKGDQVTFEGGLWESAVNTNVWQPGTYGWTRID